MLMFLVVMALIVTAWWYLPFARARLLGAARDALRFALAKLDEHQRAAGLHPPHVALAGSDMTVWPSGEAAPREPVGPRRAPRQPARTAVAQDRGSLARTPLADAGYATVVDLRGRDHGSRTQPMCELELLTEGRPGMLIELGAGTHRIGRGADCSMRIPAPGVSMRHAVLTVGASELLIRDTNSTNGTRVRNGDARRDTALSVGDVIWLSETVSLRVLRAAVRANAPGHREDQRR